MSASPNFAENFGAVSWARPAVPRLERICQLCASGTVGDEKHLIFECPELQCLRDQWPHLFEGPQTMQAFMWQDDLIGVAKYVNACVSRMNPQGQASDQPGVAGRDVIRSDLITLLAESARMCHGSKILQKHCAYSHSGDIILITLSTSRGGK